ncbi:hypothetical protein DE146DRAFT_143034 [Phaeosphaeria sp. MPI-PUGE-AT-0046c]|nr:hypothetical protein DE146DRAFT_143034 [Phaeosphaeria sp. MPI-PUGE-AT-0046c]
MDSDSDWDNCSVFSRPSSLSSYDDCDASVYSYSSLDYFGYDSDIDLYYCPCCGPPIPRDTLLAEHFERDDNDRSWKFAPYRDLRSAARSRRRKRQDRRMCHSYKCRKEGQAYADTRNTKAKREIKRFAALENQEGVLWQTPIWTPTGFNWIEWDIHQPDEDNQFFENMHDIERYSILHRDASIFESPQPFIEVGETFSTWCQRRINEMRNVQESRLRAGTQATLKPMLWRRKYNRRYLKQYDIFTGDATTTTLPTNAYDALGHELMRSVLTPTRSALFKSVTGFQWFGEYEWEWYRNAWGVWKIRYAGPHNGLHYDLAIECPFCWGQDQSMIQECCRVQSEIEMAWEEGQRCSLVEWVGTEGRELILREEQEEKPLEVGCVVLMSDDAWEIGPSVSSDAWSVVVDDVQ